MSNKIFGAKFDANGLVVQCGGIYSVLAGQCVINTQWCVWYNVMGTCQSCEKGYDLDEKNSCVERSEKTCSSVGNVGECLVSASGYAVINGACYSVTVLAASSISYGYFIYTSTSISINWPLLPNCVIQYIISTCFQCSPGFTLLNNTCVLYRANCNNYSFYGICTTCES